MPNGRMIGGIVGLFACVAAGVGLAIGNAWAFGDGSSTMTTYLTTPVPQDKSAMTRSTPGMGDELAIEVEGEGIVMLENNGTLPTINAANDIPINDENNALVDFCMI